MSGYEEGMGTGYFPEPTPEELTAQALALLEDAYKSGFVNGDPLVDAEDLEAVMDESWREYAKRMGWMK